MIPPVVPPILLQSGARNVIRAGAPVIGQGQWNDMANAAAWLLAHRGASLVSAGPDFTAITPGSTMTLPFFVWPNKAAVSRIWRLQLTSDATGGTHSGGAAFGTVEAPAGTTIGKWSIGGARGQTDCFMFVESISSPTDTEAAIDFVIKGDAFSIGGAIVQGLTCSETPRVIMTTLSGVGVTDPFTDESDRPIYAESTSIASINSVARLSDAVVTRTRRACLFTWYASVGITKTYSSFTNPFAKEIFVNTRALYAGETKRFVSWAVLAKKTGGTGDAQFRVVVGSGSATSTINVNSTSPSWYIGGSSCWTEDVSVLDSGAGIRGATRETLTLELKKNLADSITVYAFCVGEEIP